jgi:hypothetical protein
MIKEDYNPFPFCRDEESPAASVWRGEFTQAVLRAQTAQKMAIILAAENV